LKLIADRDSALRWWGVTGLGVHGGSDEALLTALDDAAPVVRVAAADALRRRGKADKILGVLTKCLADENPWVRHAAALAIDELGAKAAPARAALEAAKKDTNQYVVRVVSHTLGVLGEPRTK
jgi:HEAT repeat protein